MIDVAVGLMEANSGGRAEEWLEWKTERVSFIEFGRLLRLTDGLAGGIKQWGKSQTKSFSSASQI